MVMHHAQSAWTYLLNQHVQHVTVCCLARYFVICLWVPLVYILDVRRAKAQIRLCAVLIWILAKNPNLKKKFFVFGRGELGGGGCKNRDSDRKQNNRYSLIFVLMLYIKFLGPGSSGSLVLTQTKGSKGQILRGITIFYWILSKAILTWILNNFLNF